MVTRRRPLLRGKPRSREWIGFWTSPQADPANQAFLTVGIGVQLDFAVLDPLDMGTTFDEPTLVRSILRWQVYTDPLGPSGTTFVEIGLAAYTYNPAAAGQAPDLLLDWAMGAWLWTTSCMFTNTQTAGLVAFTNEGGDKSNFEDIRTKRRFPTGTALVFSIRNDGNSSDDVAVSVMGRCLFLN